MDNKDLLKRVKEDNVKVSPANHLAGYYCFGRCGNVLKFQKICLYLEQM